MLALISMWVWRPVSSDTTIPPVLKDEKGATFSQIVEMVSLLYNQAGNSQAPTQSDCLNSQPNFGYLTLKLRVKLVFHSSTANSQWSFELFSLTEFRKCCLPALPWSRTVEKCPLTKISQSTAVFSGAFQNLDLWSLLVWSSNSLFRICISGVWSWFSCGDNKNIFPFGSSKVFISEMIYISIKEIL